MPNNKSVGKGSGDLAATPTNPKSTTIAVVGVLLVLVGLLSWLARVPEDALVVYCAHDSIYSGAILEEFKKRTGIPLVIRYDTEATKSLGLVNLLIAEKEDPVCDVFWNNEVLGTMKLKQQGLLQSYSQADSSRIPSRFRDPDGAWIGFAARLRVWIVNTDLVQDTAFDESIHDLARLADSDMSNVAMAKPLYGTTLTHYSVLTKAWGLEKLRRWHRATRAKGLQEVNGNAVVKNLVANGKADYGWTDTDDYSLAVEAKSPVRHVPVVLNGKTICIPNSVAIIRGTKKLSNAEKLVEFLTSAEVEVLLANSRSRQIPLGEVDETQLPTQVREWRSLARNAFDLNSLVDAHQECLEWLRSEYSQ
jgi:iron(III) transport system substrate-binding protein